MPIPDSLYEQNETGANILTDRCSILRAQWAADTAGGTEVTSTLTTWVDLPCALRYRAGSPPTLGPRESAVPVDWEVWLPLDEPTALYRAEELLKIPRQSNNVFISYTVQPKRTPAYRQYGAYAGSDYIRWGDTFAYLHVVNAQLDPANTMLILYCQEVI